MMSQIYISLVMMQQNLHSFYQYVLLHAKCFLSECPRLKHSFSFTCWAKLYTQTLLLQRGNMFQN